MKIDTIEEEAAKRGMRWWNSLSVDQRRYETNKAAVRLGKRPSDVSPASVWESWQSEVEKAGVRRET